MKWINPIPSFIRQAIATLDFKELDLIDEKTVEAPKAWGKLVVQKALGLP
jgi:hypothetical protein